MPTPFALIVLVAGWWARADRIVSVYMLACLFGASAAFLLPGGAPITPAVALLPFVVAWAFSREGAAGFARLLRPGDPAFWLALLVLWAVASAFLLPRWFAGETLVRAAERGSLTGVELVPLRPLAGNITQSAYALGGLAAFLALRVLLAAPGALRRFADAVLVLAFANAAAALLGLAEVRLNLPSLLALVKNAGYAVMVGGEIGGLVRITGTFSEASAFSAFTLPLLAFTAALWRQGVRPRANGLAALALLGLLLASTSATAYAALGAYGALAVALTGVRTLAGRDPVRIGPLAVFAWGGAVLACAIVLVHPDAVTSVARYVDTALVRKLESSSGLERSSWNLQAWRNFLDTAGVGAGLGSARASSFVLVLLSNVGVAGVVLFGAFAARLLGAALPADPGEAAIARAARHAAVATLIAKSVSGTVFDLGMAFHAFAAAASVAACVRRLPQLQKGARHGFA